VNDVDLRNERVQDCADRRERICPKCDVVMPTVQVGAARFKLEQCPECRGIFFDPGELDTILENAAGTVQDVDFERFEKLVNEELPESPTVRYLACPVCKQLMNRRAYGERSGVVIDRCKAHGVWLDAGELRQLRNWAKAGGLKYAKARLDEKTRAEERERRQNERLSRGLLPDVGRDDDGFRVHSDGDIFGMIFRLFW
jgi:Zn-finger nucleic acid-binding protein